MTGITTADASRLRALAQDMVKAAQRWEAATPGTQTKRRLYARWSKAELAFEHALAELVKGE